MMYQMKNWPLWLVLWSRVTYAFLIITGARLLIMGIIIISVKNSFCSLIFCGFFFTGFFDEQKVQKNSIYLK